MSKFFFVLMCAAAVAVVASLMIGVFAMAKGGETGKKYSNRMMKARVILQGLAIILFILAAVTAGT